MPGSLTKFLDDLPMVKLVDVGASLTGHVDYQALIDADKVEIVGFDGDVDAAEKAALHFGSRARILPYLIGDGRMATFRETRFAKASSLYAPNPEVASMFTQLPGLLEIASETAVQTVRLDDVEEIDSADALFIDVQGGELDVIRNAERIMKDLLVVHTEVEFVDLYEGQPLFADLDPVIRGHGMMFHRFHWLDGRPFAPIIVAGDENKNLKHQIWGDAVYFADPRRFGELSNDQLLKLALIMNDVYGSIDVAFVALQAFDRRNGTRHAPNYMTFLTTPS